MSKTDLQAGLIANAGFRSRYYSLAVDSVAGQFPNLLREDVNVTVEHDWSYLLLCASVLSQSDSERYQVPALRIAQSCLEHDATTDNEKHAAAVILDTLANHPAIRLAEERSLLRPEYYESLPFPLYMDWTRRSITHAIFSSNNKSLKVNRFQRRFWDSADDYDWVSISAPTSAGKSFIVGQWLSKYLRISPHRLVVYIVPTRALIQQVERDIKNVLTTAEVEDWSVATMPLRSSIKTGSSNILVFTQERLHVLLSAFKGELPIDLLIIDEAQKVGDGYRGVLLQHAIERVVNRNPNCRVVFASPMTQNPGILLDDMPREKSGNSIIGEDTMVNQNLIWVSQMSGKPREFQVELVFDGTPNPIGIIRLDSSPSAVSKRLPFVAFALGNPKGGNLVYVNGAADAEKTAKQLFDLAGEECDCSDDPEVRGLVELVRSTIHRDYSLGHVLRRRIAFHYGNLPLIIRTEIERLFSQNRIRYLVCTSTLVEGVNMPCQSIFVRGPQKGRNSPMTPSDFWNLAGRAGRWGKEFQGNVICVDARVEGVWKMDAPLRRAKFPISRTSDRILEESERLISFIDNRAPRTDAVRNPNLEYVFSYLVSTFIQNGSISDTIWARRFSQDLVGSLEERISALVSNMSVPRDIVLGNPGISPIAMDNLLEYFVKRTTERGEPVEELIPVPAESADAFETYVRILHRINSHFGFVFGRSGRVRQLALLITDWMKGYPLSRIISSRQNYYQRKGDRVKLPKLIRDSMKDVEEVARFQAPKFLTCYVDVLRFYLTWSHQADLLAQVRDLNILLEFGVSQTTQLSLIGLGLSRSSAIIISEYIADDSLGEQDCLKWFVENNWIVDELPEVVQREIESVLPEFKARP